MRILYGLCGEGSGHATRSAVVIRHLHALGHDVLVVVPKQVAHILKRTGAATTEIVGLRMHCADGAMDLLGTLERNARQIPEMMSRNASAWADAEAFDPDACVTDYDAFPWLFADAHGGLPVVSIDNAQVLTRCEIAPELARGIEGGLAALETFSRAMAPACKHYVVTSFFYPPVRAELRERTTLVPPVLRDEVLEALREPPPAADHVLVYKTASLDDAGVLAEIAQVDARFLLYGFASEGETPANCERRPFSEAGFVKDLASSRAVVCNAGMSLAGEALAFGKPVFAVPVRGQYEQVLNARYIAHSGFGAMAERLTATALRAFLKRLDEYAARVGKEPRHDANARLRATVESLFGKSPVPGPRSPVLDKI